MTNSQKGACWVIKMYQANNTHLKERFCTVCEIECYELEGESHFLLQCSLYDDLRSKWVSHIANKIPNVIELGLLVDTIDKFRVIFDIHHRIMAKFIFRFYQLRKENLFKLWYVHFICALFCSC